MASVNSGEIIVCPYDKCHRITGDILSKHLLKCRKNYQLTQAANEEGTWAMRCKYNPNHIVYPPELLFHESRCEDKHLRFPVHELNQLMDHVVKTGDDAQVEATEKVFENQVKLWQDGLFLKTKMSSHNLGLPALCSVNQNQYPQLYKMMKAEEVMKEAERKKQEEGVTNLNLSSLGAASLPPQQAKVVGVTNIPGSGNQEVVEDSDDEDWGKSAKKSSGGFYYRDNLLHPSKPLMNAYPPGLSKAERREYDKFNTRWIRSIREKEEEQEMAAEMRNLGVAESADTPSSSGTGTNAVKPEGNQDGEKK